MMRIKKHTGLLNDEDKKILSLYFKQQALELQLYFDHQSELLQLGQFFFSFVFFLKEN